VLTSPWALLVLGPQTSGFRACYNRTDAATSATIAKGKKGG